MTTTYVFTDFGSAEHEQFFEGPTPEPGPGQLLIDVRAAGVNPYDWKLRSGLFGRKAKLPRAMGVEAAGVVRAVGPDVEGFPVGTEVVGTVAKGFGGYADQTVLRAAATVEKPAALSFTDAAVMPVAGVTAYDGTHQIELERGQTLVILGAGGGVGTIATQIGGVHKFNVIGVAGESKQDYLRGLGATPVVYGPGLADRLRAASSGTIDLVLDLVGGDSLRAALEVVSADRIITTVDSGAVAEHGVLELQHDPEALKKIVDVASYGLIDPQVTVVPLAEAGRAVAEVEGGHSTGNIVLVP
ncbi:NADP-dependent oxidoreductase [Brevibacterium daeguense]|uniref:NADP-dependent oxidoreductase n=1 Tax=Brevibacterium daeguense TaxID=909936 RepID=A0ABP8EK54_9MICO|nr:NADP-dependent oxidoreductase [Brevibacterium daeguense]